VSRWGRRRADYVAGILRQGPTEAGYAFFRARRRARNIADEEGVLTKLDRLILDGELDLDAGERAANERVLAAYAQAVELELHTLQWFLPWFHNPHGGGVRTILRVAADLAEKHGVESRFHIYDRTEGQAVDIPAKLGEAFPSLRGATVTTARPGDRASSHLPPCGAAVATTWPSAFPLARFGGARAKFFFVQDYEPAFHPAGAVSAVLPEAPAPAPAGAATGAGGKAAERVASWARPFCSVRCREGRWRGSSAGTRSSPPSTPSSARRREGTLRRS